VIPHIVNTTLDQRVHPVLSNKIVDVRLTNTGRDAHDQLVANTGVDARERLVVNAKSPATLIAHEFGPLDANQRRRVSRLAKFRSHLIVDKVPIREYLEVAIAVFIQYLEQLWMHERFAAEDSEEAVAMFLGVDDELVNVCEREVRLRCGDVDPTTGTPKIAGVGNRNV